jgi:hypothetical protein
LGDGAGREGFDVDVGTSAGVAFLMPAGESGEEEEGDEGEDDGDNAVSTGLAGKFAVVGG